MGDETVVKKFTPKFQIATRGFVAFPAWFIDEGMALGKNIPPSFWKFLMILFRDCNHHKDNSCRRSMRQFHMRSEDASKWTAAVMVAGLFHVSYGWKNKTAERGVPTCFVYMDSDFQDWEIFLEALGHQLAADKMDHYNDSGGGFRAALLIRIVKLQKEKHCKPAEKWQRDYLTRLGNAGFVKASRDENGVATFEVTGRLRSQRDGVLNAREKYYDPGNGGDVREPYYDEDTGKFIRAYRQRERSVSKITIDFGMRTIPTPEQ